MLKEHFRTVFAALLVVTVSVFCVVSYLSKIGLLSPYGRAPDAVGRLNIGVIASNRTATRHGMEQDFPLPDARHRVVKISNLRYIHKMDQGKFGKYINWLKSYNIVDDRARSIVLRYRPNTSTYLEPKQNAGHLSIVYMGRTGNMMYQYAGLYGIARRCGLRHVISSDNSLLRLFRLNVTVVHNSRPGRDWGQFVTSMGYDRHTEYFLPQNNVELVGYMRSWKYFGHVMFDLVHDHFRFRYNIEREADKFLRRSMARFHLSPSDVAVIAVHIRRTDLLRKNLRQGRSHSVPGKEYLSHAVNFFNRLFSNKTMYVVCSDDIKWSKKNFMTTRPTAFSVGHSADVDFAILSRCNHSIITIGTFGQWSAYLAGGVTVYHRFGSRTHPAVSASHPVAKTDDPRTGWIALS